MSTLPPELEDDSEQARLIPVDKNAERRATSALLAVFQLIPEYAAMMLDEVGGPTGKRAKLHTYREASFRSKRRRSRPNNQLRVDGYLVVESRGRRWTAIVETKVNNETLGREQIEAYLDLARKHKVDAVITISNEFALLPSHHPVDVSGHKTRSVGLYHFSWLALLSNARLLLDSQALLDAERAFVLQELIRFLEKEDAVACPFDRMDRAWREVCEKVKKGERLAKTDNTVQEAVADWHQLTRYLALELSSSLGEPVQVYIKRPHRRNPDKRLDADIDDLQKHYVLSDEFKIPNAASRIRLTADMNRRKFELSMRLDPPADRKRPTAAINWLTRQLRHLDGSDDAKAIELRAHWSGRRPPTRKSLKDCLEYPKLLVPEGVSELPHTLEVIRMHDLGRRFSRVSVFVDRVRGAFDAFYRNVGQHLRPWRPPPPEHREEKPDRAILVSTAEDG